MSSSRSFRQKNIVLVTLDQIGARDFGCYGSGVDSTPTMDDLARRGTRFARCYASYPICAPNRATLMTGRGCRAHGLATLNHNLQPDTPTIAHVLSRAGYRCGAFGKLHLESMLFPIMRDARRFGFVEGVITEDPKWGPWLDWVREKHPRHYELALAMCWDERADGCPRQPRDEAESRLYDRVRGEFLAGLAARTPWPMVYGSELPAECHDTTFITNGAVDFIERHLAATPDRPFLCHVSYVDPHDPYDPPHPYDRMFAPADMPAPLPMRWDRDRLRTLARCRRRFGMDKVSDNPAIMAMLRSHFHGSVRFIDDQLARVLRTIERHGRWDDTVFVVTSDHGEMLGDHGLLTKDVKPYDRGIRCPLIVAGGGLNAGQTSDRLVCTRDFFASLCEFADVPAMDVPPHEGRSFAGTCRGGPAEPGWPEVVVAYRDVQTLVTDDGWRLTRFRNDATGQMFNLADDPDEQNDLWLSAAQAEQRARLHERFVDALTLHDDQSHYRTMPVRDGRRLWVETFDVRPGPGDGLTEIDEPEPPQNG